MAPTIDWGRWSWWGAMDTVGLPLLSIIAACIYIFRPQDWFPEVQQAVPMVFSCVASRNKRRRVPVGARGWSYPNCVLSASLRFEEPRGPLGRNSFAQTTARLSPYSVKFGLSPTPPSGKAAGRQGRRFGEPQKHGQQLDPNPSPVLGPARLENRLRFSSPKNKHSPTHGPKQSPVLRPVSASLRLRFRSATFTVARGNSCRIGRAPTGRICPLNGRARPKGVLLAAST